jgi:hypothetical protein
VLELTDGVFTVRYYDTTFPIAPHSYNGMPLAVRRAWPSRSPSGPESFSEILADVTLRPGWAPFLGSPSAHGPCRGR